MRFHSSVTFVWNSSHSKKNCARCDKNCIMIFMSSTCYSRPILMKLQFTRYIFEKHSNIKLHEKTVQWELSCSMWTDGRTRHDEANSRFSQFCEKRPNIVCPTRYRIRHFFNNCNTNEDTATKFEQEYVRCVRNEEECVYGPLQISLQYPH